MKYWVKKGGGEYEEGETAVLTARGWRAYRFQRWDDGDTTNPRRIVVAQDTAFTAMFTDPEGIEPAYGRESGVEVLPNPAKERVRVQSGCGLSGVEVYDAQGRSVPTMAVEGNAVEIDVSQWVLGSYVLLVHTERGTVSKRLIVE